MGAYTRAVTSEGGEDFDVVIVGAGLSGIGAACHLQAECPGKRFVILEARAESGGTWDLFRYPGVRSDSDMFTLGYSFRPWREAKAIADGPSILRYIRAAAHQHGVDRRVRYHRRVVRAAWSSSDARWTVEVENAESGELERLTCRFLYGNTGYYRYDEGYSPRFEGASDFGGRIVHPQHWPADLEWEDRSVVVIGSGATAVTLVPALAARASHVTMLQRSPSYVMSLPEHDGIADLLRHLLPERLAYPLVRWKNVVLTTFVYQLCRRAPRLMARLWKKGVASQLPADFDVETHFSPRYSPWDQRLCFVPDGDLFKALSSGRASVVTGQIERLTGDGVLLDSGATLDADIIVSATGLNMQMLGGMAITVDGRPLDLAESVAYKGIMLCGVPNLAFTIGYTNASWTLKADLAARYVCRLLNYMDERGARSCRPIPPDPQVPRIPLMDLTSGYVRRSVDRLPKQAATMPWRLHQNYPLDIMMLRRGPLDDQMAFDDGDGDGSSDMDDAARGVAVVN